MQICNIQTDEDKIDGAINYIKYINLLISGLMRIEREKVDDRKNYKVLIEKTKHSLSKILKEIITKEQQREPRICLPKEYFKDFLRELQNENKICFIEQGQGIRFSFHKREKEQGKEEIDVLIDLFTVRNNQIKVNILHKKIRPHILKLFTDTFASENTKQREKEIKEGVQVKRKIFLEVLEAVRDQYFKRLKLIMQGSVRCAGCDSYMKYDQKQKTFLPAFLTSTRDFKPDNKDTNPKFYHQKCFEQKSYFY